MKRAFLVAAILAGAAGAGGWVSAQTTTPASPTTPPAKTAPQVERGRGMGPGPGMMGGGMGMMGGGMGMMGGGGMGMMGGMCHMGMGSADTKIDVKNVDKGVTITITSTDPARVTRLQKMAQAMRLMHEANTP
jgi:hypothetical protein